MQQYIQTITRHFFKKDDLEQVSREDLEEFIATYPYSSAGHLLLTKKLQQQDAAAFREQAAVTSLYFTNPLWLHWILDEALVNGRETAKEHSAGHQKAEQETGPEKADNSESSAKAWPSEEDVIIDEEGAAIINDPLAEEASSATISIGEEVRAGERPPFTKSFFAEENILEDVTAHHQDIIPATETINEPFTIEETPADDHEATSVSSHEPATKDNGPLKQTATATDLTAQHVTADNSPSEQPASPADIPTGQVVAGTDPGHVHEEQAEPIFQSYHTIDYFASLGIRLRQEDLSKDRFGQQVKSFTEWLRNMKRIIPATSAEEEASSNATIQAIAAHSFNEKDVITETMAEVWIKQGNNEKAVAVYEKLSLLNPSKSAYFAAKIEQLKAQ